MRLFLFGDKGIVYVAQSNLDGAGRFSAAYLRSGKHRADHHLIWGKILDAPQSEGTANGRWSHTGYAVGIPKANSVAILQSVL
jgi:hypothetical protein